MPLFISAQDRKQIEIEYAPYMDIVEDKPGATILTRNNSNQVHVKHKGIELWCNEAIYYGNEDFIEAFGNKNRVFFSKNLCIVPFDNAVV